MVPFLGTLNNRCRIIIGTQRGTIILTTTLMMSLGVLLVGSLDVNFWGFYMNYNKEAKSLTLTMLNYSGWTCHFGGSGLPEIGVTEHLRGLSRAGLPGDEL